MLPHGARIIKKDSLVNDGLYSRLIKQHNVKKNHKKTFPTSTMPDVFQFQNRLGLGSSIGLRSKMIQKKYSYSDPKNTKHKEDVVITNTDNSEKKTCVCKFWKMGTCYYMDSPNQCKYLHSSVTQDKNDIEEEGDFSIYLQNVPSTITIQDLESQVQGLAKFNKFFIYPKSNKPDGSRAAYIHVTRRKDGEEVIKKLNESEQGIKAMWNKIQPQPKLSTACYIGQHRYFFVDRLQEYLCYQDILTPEISYANAYIRCKNVLVGSMD